jgi:hypothetical protein
MLFDQSHTVVKTSFRKAAYDILDRIEAGALAKSKSR